MTLPPAPPDKTRSSHDDPPASTADLTEPSTDSDHRPLWQAQSRYTPSCRSQQSLEGWYIFALLLIAIGILAAVPLGGLEWAVTMATSSHTAADMVRGFTLLAGGGLLGGTVYGAKWLYHAVAKGLWHEDRRLWRLLSPWISLGATIGVGAIIHSGLLSWTMPAPAQGSAALSLVGLGFVLGYFTDRALAKMKEVTDVLFGQSRTTDKMEPPSGKD